MRSRSRRTFALSTLFQIAVVLALLAALPVSQLRLLSYIVDCCCPDPDHCSCPDHPSAQGTHSKMVPCHKTVDTLESAGTPSFTPGFVITELVPARALVSIHHTYATPHEPPSLERPSAPS
jgi:hypothetical protein